MSYHVLFCVNSLFSEPIDGKQMCFSFREYKSFREVMSLDFVPFRFTS